MKDVLISLKPHFWMLLIGVILVVLDPVLKRPAVGAAGFGFLFLFIRQLVQAIRNKGAGE